MHGDGNGCAAFTNFDMSKVSRRPFDWSCAAMELASPKASPPAVAVPAGGANVSDPLGGAALCGVAQRMLEEVAGDVKGLETEIHTGVGDPAEVIIRTADEVGADLIVVGSRGMQRRVRGSVPHSVAHGAGCAVLVVKTD